MFGQRMCATEFTVYSRVRRRECDNRGGSPAALALFLSGGHDNGLRQKVAELS
jgi:hypothetical protein